MPRDRQEWRIYEAYLKTWLGVDDVVILHTRCADEPLLMAPGQTTGFGFLSNVAINPHLTSAMRDAELVNVIDAYPHILGIGIDDDAALLVQQNIFEVTGIGRVAIYDNVRRNGQWYYWLQSSDRFDLSTWSKLSR